MRKQSRFRRKKQVVFFFLFLKQVFLKLTIFYFKKQRHSDKSNHIFWKCIKNNGSVDLNTFLNFVDVSSYLRLKGCAVSFELQSRKLYRPHFGKLLQSSIKENQNCNPPNAWVMFTCRRILRLYLLFKWYNFSITV